MLAPPTPPLLSPVIPAPEQEPMGRARQPPQPSSPHQHPLTPYRRAGAGRYPGDGRGYPDKHPKNQTAHTHSTVVPGSDLTPPSTTHQHPLTPCRRAGVGRYPGNGRGYPHKHPKNQTAHSHKPSSLRHSPPAQFVIPSAAEESKPFLHHPQPTNTIVPDRPTTRHPRLRSGISTKAETQG